MPLKEDTSGISETVAVIIIIAAAIVLTIAVAYWIFGLASTSTKTIELIIHPLSINTTNNELKIMIYNPSDSRATVTGLHLGNYTCIANNPQNFIIIPSGKTIQLTISFSGYTAIINNEYQWQCIGAVKLMNYVQYDGDIITDNGYQFPFTISSQ